MNGVLIVNKPLGYTSRDIVNKVGKILNTKKIGHTGTLDPNASGVLVLCIGKALKMCELINGDKEYIATVILGIETDTLDLDSNATVIKEKDVHISNQEIIDAVNFFKGKYMQEVPKYSAVKVNGHKLYEYARNNIDVELPKKEVNIKNIKILDDIKNDNGKISFKIKCTVSKGTYIRALIRDIGKKMGVPAVMKDLVRTKIDNFTINDSFSIEDIENNNYRIIDIIDAFSDIPLIKVNDSVAFKVKNGVILDKFFDSNIAFIADKNNQLIALYKNIDNESRPYKMFVNLSIESRHKKF